MFNSLQLSGVNRRSGRPGGIGGGRPGPGGATRPPALTVRVSWALVWGRGGGAAGASTER